MSEEKRPIVVKKIKKVVTLTMRALGN